MVDMTLFKNSIRWPHVERKIQSGRSSWRRAQNRCNFLGNQTPHCGAEARTRALSMPCHDAVNVGERRERPVYFSAALCL